MALTNGDFETGDFTGWTTDTSEGGGDFTSTATVTTGAKQSGTYGARLYVTAENAGWGASSIIAILDDTGWDFLSLNLMINNLTRDAVGYSEIWLSCQMTISSTPTWVIFRYLNASEANSWRPHLVLFDELEKKRIDNSGTWADDEIPFKISLYHCANGATETTGELFVDNVAVSALGAFSNGDFEDGDLSEWYDTSYVYMNSSDELGGTGTVVASTTEKHAGSYAAKYACTFLDTVSDGAVYAVIERPIVLADFTELSFWYKVTDSTGGNPKFQVRAWVYNTDYDSCEWVTLWEISGGDDFTEGSWTEVTISKATMESTLFHQEFLDTTVFQLVSNQVYLPS